MLDRIIEQNKNTMKTSVNSIVGKLGKTAALFGVLAIIIASCTQMESPFSVQEPDVKSFEDLNINVKYAESYDQTTITYSRHWPSSISTGLAKTVSDGEGEIMVDYERVHEIVAFDEDGYMSTSIEFLEGDSEMNMPESAYEELSEVMPAKASDYNPVTRIIIDDGKISQYGKNGDLLFELPIDKESYRIDPKLLNAAEATSQSQNAHSAVQGNIAYLNSIGINHSIIGEFYAKYETKAAGLDLEDGVDKKQYVRDLRNGNLLVYAEINSDGKYLNIIESRYTDIEGASILSSESYYTFGDINGKWGISERSVMTRENIKIIKN